MQQPFVSVIIPIYNVEKYLQRCIDAACEQTLKNIEIILVDDESPDNCPSICEEAAKKDSRIKVIHKKNEGLGLARNSGLEIASGEYVYFVDSDDYLEKTALERLYRQAEKSKLDMCFSGIYSHNERGEVRKSESPAAGREFTQPEISTVVLKGMLGAAPENSNDTELRMSVWQGIYRRRFLEDHHLRFPSEREFISEDMIFHLDALPVAERMKYIRGCVYHHIEDNPVSLTHKYNPCRFEKVTSLYREEIRRIRLLADHEGMEERAQRMYLANVRVCLKQIVRQSMENGKPFAMEQIRKIVENETLNQVLRVYPYQKNPWKQAVMSFCLGHQYCNIIYFLTRMFISQ